MLSDMHVYVVGLNTSVPEPQYRSPPMMSTRGKRQKWTLKQINVHRPALENPTGFHTGKGIPFQSPITYIQIG